MDTVKLTSISNETAFKWNILDPLQITKRSSTDTFFASLDHPTIIDSDAKGKLISANWIPWKENVLIQQDVHIKFIYISIQ